VRPSPSRTFYEAKSSRLFGAIKLHTGSTRPLWELVRWAISQPPHQFDEYFFRSDRGNSGKTRQVPTRVTNVSSAPSALPVIR
jgi:hypothetical protein